MAVSSETRDPDAFVDAIRREPDNDIPRRQYADFLTRIGDVRAELIRLQCPDLPPEQAKIHEAMNEERIKTLGKHERGRSIACILDKKILTRTYNLPINCK